MNDNRIAEIQQRCEAATPSPWEVEKYYHDEPYEQFIKSAAVVSTYEDGSKGTITRNNWSNPVVADLEFIAHAREDIPYLLAQLAERVNEIERLREAITSVHESLDFADTQRQSCKNYTELAINNGLALGQIAVALKHDFKELEEGAEKALKGDSDA